MRTDPALIARLAGEIDQRFRGAKVRDLGLLPDKRTAIVLWSRGEEYTLCFDVFGTPPLVTLEARELPIAAEPGFIRAAGAALRGTVLLAAKARKGDRLLRLTFGTRSRFGVGDESDLYVELVPRFGNIVLVRNERIVAAAKEFSLAQNGTRAVEAGGLYQLPPLNARERAPLDEVAGSVLDAMTSARNDDANAGERRRSDDRRRALLRRLDERERKLRDERAALDQKLDGANARGALREEADAIYAVLHELPPEQRDERKEHAAKLFARYKKLGTSIAHIEERIATVDASLSAIESMRWETERAGDRELADVEEAIAQLDPRQVRASAKSVTRRKRAPLEVRTAAGSRILIGRSPVENADLTFRVARPNDWWFHAQNIPGAHVILQRDDRTEPPARRSGRSRRVRCIFLEGPRERPRADRLYAAQARARAARCAAGFGLVHAAANDPRAAARARDVRLNSGRRPSQQIALDEVDAVLPRPCELFFSLDAFGDDANPQFSNGIDQPRREHGFIGIAIDVLHQRHIELHEIGMQFVDERKGRVSRAEVVERDAKAFLAVVIDDRAQVSGIVDAIALHDFEDDAVRLDAVALKRRDRRGKTGARVVDRRGKKIDEDVLANAGARCRGDCRLARDTVEVLREILIARHAERFARSDVSAVVRNAQQRLVSVDPIALRLEDRLEERGRIAMLDRFDQPLVLVARG